MKLPKPATAVWCMALPGTVLVPGARADAWNRKTTITFGSPVLPAGTYVFGILDSQSDRHIVQIFSKDEKSIYATILAIPNYRLKATDKTVVTFRERPAGEPDALRDWFYRGRNRGEGFVYPKARAMALAKETHLPVLFAAVELPADAPVVLQLKQAPSPAIQPTGEEVQLAEVVTAPPAMADASVADPALPATAGTLPLIALFGLMALLAAFATRTTAKRIQ